jgi:hypothetical protein
MRYAATRDASWTRGGGGSAGVVKHHIVAEPLRDELSECGVPVVAMHHDIREAIPAADVPENLRCQRPKCRAHWPAMHPTTAKE